MNHEAVTVPIPGMSKELVLLTDPATGRTAVRIDGRAVMSPLAAHEDEREFTLGATKYLLRRLPDGEFDVDFAPPDLAAGGMWTAAAPAPPASEPKKSGLAIGGVLITVLLAVTGRVCWRSIRPVVSSWGTPIEITSFTCEPSEKRGQFDAVVEVKNLTSDPLELTGHITIEGIGRSRTDYAGRVEPSPLPPGETGRMHIRDYTPDSLRFADAQCVLKHFAGADGKRLEYREAKK